jgi:hypothetical protein
LITGAIEFVVHEAIDMMLSFSSVYLKSFTPKRMVMSTPFAGEEMITFFAPASIFFLALFASVNLDDSITK